MTKLPCKHWPHRLRSDTDGLAIRIEASRLSRRGITLTRIKRGGCRVAASSLLVHRDSIPPALAPGFSPLQAAAELRLGRQTWQYCSYFTATIRCQPGFSEKSLWCRPAERWAIKT